MKSYAGFLKAYIEYDSSFGQMQRKGQLLDHAMASYDVHLHEQYRIEDGGDVFYMDDDDPKLIGALTSAIVFIRSYYERKNTNV